MFCDETPARAVSPAQTELNPGRVWKLLGRSVTAATLPRMLAQPHALPALARVAAPALCSMRVARRIGGKCLVVRATMLSADEIRVSAVDVHTGEGVVRHLSSREASWLTAAAHDVVGCLPSLVDELDGQVYVLCRADLRVCWGEGPHGCWPSVVVLPLRPECCDAHCSRTVEQSWVALITCESQLCVAACHPLSPPPPPPSLCHLLLAPFRLFVSNVRSCLSVSLVAALVPVVQSAGRLSVAFAASCEPHAWSGVFREALECFTVDVSPAGSALADATAVAASMLRWVPDRAGDGARLSLEQ